MREIDNNINSVNFKGIQKPVTEEITTVETSVAASDSKEVKDLSAMPAATLGKSQVSSDSLESDMKFLSKNPKLVEELNKAIDNYAQTHTEEETLQLMEKVHQEFVAKK